MNLLSRVETWLLQKLPQGNRPRVEQTLEDCLHIDKRGELVYLSGDWEGASHGRTRKLGNSLVVGVGNTRTLDYEQPTALKEIPPSPISCVISNYLPELETTSLTPCTPQPMIHEEIKRNEKQE